jgi:hypothetical protein
MTPDQTITIQFPQADPDICDVVTTWAAFVAENDEDTVADVAEQIASDNYAVIGGGAAPVIWIFA